MIKKIIFRALISSFFRSIVGATFIVSGIIKGNDSIAAVAKVMKEETSEEEASIVSETKTSENQSNPSDEQPNSTQIKE